MSLRTPKADVARCRRLRSRRAVTCLHGALNVGEEAGGVWAAGEIDYSSALTFAAMLAGLVSEGGEVAVDLREVTFMDAAGVHALVEAVASLGQRGRVVLVSPSRPVLRVLEVLGLDHGLEMRGTWSGHPALAASAVRSYRSVIQGRCS